MNRRFYSILPWANAVLLCIVVFFSTYTSLSQTQHVNGWDGYYYLVQLKSWFETGSMHSEDHSLIYPVMAAAKIVSGNYITAYKISASLARTLFILGICFYSFSAIYQKKDGDTLSGQESSIALVFLIGAAAAASPLSFYFVSQFPKNLLGFALLFWSAGFFELSLRSFQSKSRLFFLNASLFILMLFGSFITHRFSAALAAAAFMCNLFLLPGLRLSFIVGGNVLLLLLFLLLSIFFPGTLHIFDLERFSGSFSPVFTILPSKFCEVFGSENIPLYWKIELYAAYTASITVLLWIVSKIFTKKSQLNKIRPYFPLLFLMALGVFPFYVINSSSIGYRFFLAGQLAAPLILLPLLAKRRLNLWVTTAVSFILLFSSAITLRTYKVDSFDPPYSYYEELTDRVQSTLELHNIHPKLLVGHKALAEYITFTQGIDVLPWTPEERYKLDTVWRIAHAVSSKTYSTYLNNEELQTVYFLKGKYTLIREDSWKKLIHRIQKQDSLLYTELDTWQNPMHTRPAYLMRGNKK